MAATEFNYLLLTNSHMTSCEVLAALSEVKSCILCHLSCGPQGHTVQYSISVCVCVVDFLFPPPLLKPRCFVQLSANGHLHSDTTVPHTLSQIRILNPWWLHSRKCMCVSVCVSVCRLILANYGKIPPSPTRFPKPSRCQRPPRSTDSAGDEAAGWTEAARGLGVAPGDGCKMPL